MLSKASSIKKGCYATSRVTRFDSQQSTFSRRGWMYLIADSFAYYLFSFYLFSMKFMYNVNKTSSDGRIAPAQFLTDCWATLTYIFKLLIQYRYLCSRGVTPRTRNREIQGSNPVRIFVLFILCLFSFLFFFICFFGLEV